MKQPYVPFCQASISKKEINEVVDTLQSGWLTMGKKVLVFEEQFAKYIGVKHAVSVNSCTAALELALLAYDIGPGDEVLVPSFTFVASVNVIEHVGATPVFVDIDPLTLNIDCDDLQNKLTARSKAVIVVHYGGLPADMSRLAVLAKKHKLVLIEDAAHAVGSKYKNKYIGSMGNPTAFSFYATKNLTTGEGGMLTTNDAKIAEFAARNRLHGITKDAWKRYTKEGTWQYDISFPGMKCNMTDIQAAMGIHQLAKLAKHNAKRQAIVARYNQAFAQIPEITLLDIPGSCVHAHHLYVLQLNNYPRDEFIIQLTKLNIGTSVHFIPVHTFSYYAHKYQVTDAQLPHTARVAARIVSLPLFPDLTVADQNYVIKSVKQVLAHQN